MGMWQGQWPAAVGASDHLYGRVWTDRKELRPWVVLLDPPPSFAGRRRHQPPRLIFRGAGEEWAWPVQPSVRLEDLDDEALRGYLERARAR
ncbi:MAG TPA: hypothetical protein VE173_10235 [Longimicrobiales bacterium]|nr:hypothetical protein [Longimicrobiales bacterium]